MSFTLKAQAVFGKLFAFGGAILMAASAFTLDYLIPQIIFGVGALCLLAGVALAVTGSKKSKDYLVREREHDALNFVKRKGGRVTPIEMATELRWSVDESKAVLEDFSRRGIASLDVTHRGELIYAFGGLMSDAEKASARDPLDMLNSEPPELDDRPRSNDERLPE